MRLNGWSNLALIDLILYSDLQNAPAALGLVMARAGHSLVKDFAVKAFFLHVGFPCPAMLLVGEGNGVAEPATCQYMGHTFLQFTIREPY